MNHDAGGDLRPGLLHRGLRLVAVAGLVLAALLSLAWWRSVETRDWVDLYRGGHLTSESGHLILWSTGRLPTGFRRASAPVTLSGEYVNQALGEITPPGFWRDNGLGLAVLGYVPVQIPSGPVLPPPRVVPAFQAVLPYWPPILGSLATAGLAWRLSLWRLRAVRAAAGHCRDCGYDLRHSPDYCPECGAAVNRPSAPTASG